MFSVPSKPGENRGEILGEFESRSVKTRETVEGFHLLENSQTLPRLSTGYVGTDNMFYFFYKIIISVVNEEKDDIRSAYCKFLQLGESQTTLLTSFSCFIAL